MRTFVKKTERLIRKTIRKALNQHKSYPLYLNEAVNFEKQCIFIAVPKTGTTSVRSQLKQKGTPLIPNPHLNIVQVRDSLYVYLLKNALGKNMVFPTVSIPNDTDIRNQSADIFNRFYKFSAVRNPWARAVSLYFRREGVQLRDKLSFDEFCDKHFYASDTCHQPTLHKNQIDWLCDESGQCIMNYVYKLENFDEAIKEIEAQTGGRIKLEKREARKNPKSLSSAYREVHSGKTKRIIAERFQKDIDYFKYTF